MTLPESDTLSTYGGALANYGIGVVDPTTDRDADDANKAFASTAMMTRTAMRASISFTGVAATPTVSAFEAVWKGGTVTSPTPSRTGAGIFTFTWPASVLDELGATHTLNLTSASGYAESSTAYHVQAVMTSANVVTVYVWDTSWVASDAVGATITVEMR